VLVILVRGSLPFEGGFWVWSGGLVSVASMNGGSESLAKGRGTGS
jgi:hypothetical protein